MSEIKRAQLIPFATQKDNEKPLKETKKTIRISVVLPESNEHTCPEYNYKDELAAAKKLGKYKETNGANGLLRPNDLDDDDDDDVRRIAKQMEEKYGTGVSLNKKKRKGRKDDYADIGMGYDESDSFIDNTDGYDEMIPLNVTTLHGGFYINSGALEFKTDDEANSDFSSSSSSDEDDNDNDNDDDDDDDDNNDDNDNNNEENNKIKTTNRKRVIESSDETDRENKTDVDNLNQLQKKRKLQNGGNGMQQSIKKKLFNTNKIYVKKRRLVDQQKKTVKELLREKREDLNMSTPGGVNSNTVVNIDNTDKENKPTIIPTPSAITITNGSVDNVIESVVKASMKDTEVTRKSPINDNNNTTNTVTISSTSPIVTTATPPPPSSSPATIITPVKESSHDAHKVKVNVKLPENLPSDIVAIITTIQQLLIKYQNDIKNNDVNRMILRLERKSKCLGKPSKMKVYEYLANFANCKTDILIQRAKNLILDDEQKKLKTILSELKMEVDKIMPSLLENHEKESQRIIQKKFSNDSLDSEEMKSLRMPKRRFIWNDITKKLVKDILMLKKRCLLLEGKHKETLDTLMLSFLRNDIQTLWPDGWMSMNALNKIYTTYADPKRLLNNALPTNSTTTTSQNDTNSITTSSTTTTVPTTTINTTTNIKPSLKNLPQSLSNNSNLSITPVIPGVKDNKNSNNNNNSSVDVRNSDTTMNLSRTLSDKSHCDKVESRLKVKSPSELMMKPSNHHNNNSVKKLPEADITNDDSVIIIDRVSPIKDRTSHNNNNSTSSNKTDHNYQVIDLSDKNELKKSSDLINKHNLNKHHEISITPNYNSTVETTTTTTTTIATTTTITKTVDTTTKSSCGDDIQKVMEDLKALQKLSSSPKKCLIDNNMKSSTSSSPSSNSSAVSVIAVNKSFTPKTVHNHHHHHQQQQQQHHPHHHLHPHHHQQQQQHHSTMQRIDYVKNSEFGGSTSSFQGEFQKQFLNVLNQLKPTTTTTTNKNNYNSIDSFPHIATGSGMVTNDKYYQTSSNYNQGPNGHKSTSTTTTQSGTYNIIDDMFTSFLTQFGYPKEATTPKSQPK